MRKIILCLSFLFSVVYIHAQSITETVEPKVDQLMNRFIDKNKAQTTVNGWRIQILATTDRQNMENALRRFENLYPSIAVDWVHAKPYYKVQAGAFATKTEALRTLYILKPDYPGAYPVQDNKIRPEELLR
ncbi:MAG: SPOR domain-containing protein [Bacteroidota bacterium]